MFKELFYMYYVVRKKISYIVKAKQQVITGQSMIWLVPYLGPHSPLYGAMGTAVAELLNSWNAEQWVRGSIPYIAN